jgi:hypothetical protein
MAGHIDAFLSHANDTCERAAVTEGEFRRQWLRVAEMWELLAKEYRRVTMAQPRTDGGKPIRLQDR